MGDQIKVLLELHSVWDHNKLLCKNYFFPETERYENFSQKNKCSLVDIAAGYIEKKHWDKQIQIPISFEKSSMMILCVKKKMKNNIAY